MVDQITLVKPDAYLTILNIQLEQCSCKFSTDMAAEKKIHIYGLQTKPIRIKTCVKNMQMK